MILWSHTAPTTRSPTDKEVINRKKLNEDKRTPEFLEVVAGFITLGEISSATNSNRRE
jgi:hypothetical protein